MRHGDLSRESAQKILHIRRKLDEAGIPPTKVDENLIIGTWNIRDFGKSPRDDDAIRLIAEIINQFDILALVELRDDLSDLKRVLHILGDYWDVIFSDFRADDAGNRERIAYIFDARVVKFTGLAAEANPHRKKIDGRYEEVHEDWWRSPYMVSFTSGNFDFVIITAHIRWSGGVRARAKAIGQFADWIEARRTDAQAADHDFIVMGDFNIPSRRSSAFRALTKHGLLAPRGLVGVEGTNLSESNTYDQIVHHPTSADRFTNRGGVIRFYEESHTEIFPDLTQKQFTHQLSDHLPLWIEIDTWIEGEQLDAALAGYGRDES